uniref:Uncharacterized protein n=1 Tax=Dulem virus 182 TaxID=3145659 RepID=A0AAU8AW30_9VIRU
MKKIYVLIGTMKVDEGTETLKNGRMVHKPIVAFNETEMKEMTQWNEHICMKWLEITINGEMEEIVTREIYTWEDEKKKIRYSQSPKYTFKKIMKVKYGNLGYDD